MPEGDTIWRTAHSLRAALVERTVTAFTSPLPGVAAAARRHRVVGSQVLAVEARGKHLLVRFSGGAVLRTHQRMIGSWHLYRPGSRWRKPAHLARVAVHVPDAVAVCFNAPVVEILSPAEEAAHPTLRQLGPDLLSEEFEPHEAQARLRARGDLEIGAALLDQTALAGIGNVYKSEVLFLCGVNPFDRVGSLHHQTLERLIAMAARQMKRNLASTLRRTTSDLSRSHLWVYGRARQPCRRCGTPIARKAQGEDARVTFWCPTCQPPL